MILIIRRDDNELEATYEVNENEQTVQELKEMIADRNFGPIVKEQRLEYNNRRMKNSHFISHYQIQDKSVIILKFQAASNSSSESNSSTPAFTDEEL
jgi:hypothetical protein